MIILLSIFAVIALLAVSYLIFILLEIKHLTEKMETIISEDTNLELTTTTNEKFLTNLVNKNNQLIRKNKKLYQLNHQREARLQQTITNVTHDLKTPLTVSSGHTQLLAKDETLSDNQKDLVEKIALNLKSVDARLKILSEYNQINEERIAVDWSQVDFSQIVKTQLVQYFDAFQQKNLSLTVEIAENVTGISDEKLFARIVQNLIGNMLEHGAAKRKILLYAQDEKIILQVSNQIKKPIHDADALFERFYTENISRNQKNSGLGLYIVQSFTALLQGKLDYEVTNDYFSIQLEFNKTPHT